MTNRIVFGLLLPVVFWSCQPGANSKNDVNNLLTDLKNSDTSIRFGAIKKLQDLTFTEEQSLTLIDAATERYPPLKYEWQNIPGILIQEATEKPVKSFIAAIEKNFPLLDSIAKQKALLFLARFDNATSIEVFTRLLLQYQKEISFFPPGIINGDHKYKDIVFPKLMELAGHESMGPDILLLFLNYLEAKSLDPGQYTKYVPAIHAQNHMLKEKIIARQKKFGSMNEIWDDKDYQDWRLRTGIILDLLGYLQHADNKKELQPWLDQNDTKLKMFAALSLLRQGETADTTVFSTIAADPETRNWLYDKLVALGKKNLFPALYMNQADFAEAGMINWLLYPTELARKPDRIELMKIITVNAKSEGLVEFYIFRFRSDHVDWIKKGWMAGVAGYYKMNNKPTSKAQGYTFSSFEKWEDKTPEEHLGDISELLEDAKKNQGKEE